MLQKTYKGGNRKLEFIDTKPISLLSARTQVWQELKTNKQTLQPQKQNRIDFIGSITAGFEMYRNVLSNILHWQKRVFPIVFKEIVQVIYLTIEEQDFAVAGLVVKS